MKKLTGILFILFIISCKPENEKFNDNPKRINITGKIVNPDADHNELKFNVNRVGLPSTQLSTELDENGNFSTSFESYIPTDVWFHYRTRFLVIIHPGDNIYVEFDGALKEPEIFESIKFKGDAIQVNREASKFQKLLSSNLYSTQEKRKQALKDYSPDEFVSYVDSVKVEWDLLYNLFITEFAPGEEAKKWASEYIYSDYLGRLPYYGLRAYYNNTNIEDLILPNDFYKPILNRRPIDGSMLVSGFALSVNLNDFYSALYKTYNLRDQSKQLALVADYAKKTQKEILDSLIVSSVIEHSPDKLYRQLMLTELFSKHMQYKSDYKIFENHQKLAKQYIKEAFLWEPLYKQYLAMKKKLETETTTYDTTLTATGKYSGGQILDSIIQTNKSKVIYLDCWATWCGPCKAEMPNSKALMEEMHDKNVAFAFLCLHSDKKDWQSTIRKLDIEGQHYFLPKDQSIDFAKLYAINGVPNYMLIDKQGNITEQGTHLRPDIVKNKIEKLLND